MIYIISLNFPLQNHHKASRFALDIPLIMFDYHYECRGGNLKNLEKLRQQLAKYLDKFEYFFSDNGEMKRFVIYKVFLCSCYHGHFCQLLYPQLYYQNRIF